MRVIVHAIFFPAKKMKSRQRILGFLVASISVYVATEILLQYNWRAHFPEHEIESLEKLIFLQESSKLKAPLIVIHSTSDIDTSITGFDIARSVPLSVTNQKQQIFNNCCSSVSEKCLSSLKEASKTLKDTFMFFHDTVCKQRAPSVEFDNVGYAVSSNPDFLDRWRKLVQIAPKFEGPFKSMYPIVFVRSIHVLTGDTVNTTHSNLDPLVSAVDGIFEIIHESTTLYGGPESIRAVEQSLIATDPHEQSRLINKELMVWTGSSHVSPFGTFSMPPISYIATVNSATSSTGLYHVDNFGFIHIPTNTSDDPILEITRLWLGGSQTVSEILSLKMHARYIFISNAVKNLSKLRDILNDFSDIRFPESTALVVQSALRHIEASLQTSLSQSLRHARIAVIESLEALNDQFVSDPPFFSTEYTFALYAPLALPICVPVISALIRYIRERRKIVIV